MVLVISLTTAETSPSLSLSAMTRITGGSHFADDEASAIAKTGAVLGDRLHHQLVVERLALLVAHALQQLRHLGEALADFGHRAAPLLEHRQQLQRRHEPVAGRREMERMIWPLCSPPTLKF